MPISGWTFDGKGNCALHSRRAELDDDREGPDQSYPVEERPTESGLDAVIWSGCVEEDRRWRASTGVTSLIHFTKVWTTNWAFLFDNFIDGLHAPYLHRLSPQFALRRLQYRVVDGKPNFNFVEHDHRILEASHVRAKNTDGLVYQMDFPGLGKFPVNNWWRIRSPKTKPKTNFIPNIAAGSFLHVLPAMSHVHKSMYFTQFIIPHRRYHLYQCAPSPAF